MPKYAEYLGRKVALEDNDWYNYFLDIHSDVDDAAQEELRYMIGSCATGSGLELMYRYLLHRKNYALEKEDRYRQLVLKARSKEDYDLADNYAAVVDHWVTWGHCIQQTLNFFTSVLGIDVHANPKEWGK